MPSDHDILIELKVEIIGMRTDISEMKSNTKATLLDHEGRLRFIERYMWLAIGIVGLLQIIFIGLSNNGFKL
jgi:hypothetical protein